MQGLFVDHHRDATVSIIVLLYLGRQSTNVSPSTIGAAKSVLKKLYKTCLNILDSLIAPNEKQIIGLENRNQEEKEPIGEGGLVSDAQKQGNFKSVLSNQEKDVEEDYDKSDKKKRRKKKQYKSNTEAELDFFLKRLINPNEIVISSIQRGEMNLDILMIQKDLTLRELMKKGILIIDPVRLSVKNDGQFILYQTISILLVHKNKHQINQRYQEKNYIDKNHFYEFIARHQKMTENKDKNHYDLFVPENILSPNHRRELRIRISFNSRDKNEKKEENRGSVEFQIVSFTNKIRRLTSHLELHKKDYLSQRGLRKILGKRQRLLSYLSKTNKIRYKELIVVSRNIVGFEVKIILVNSGSVMEVLTLDAYQKMGLKEHALKRRALYMALRTIQSR
ncbi:hypothetical protein J1N35_014080 [Gossypium stocksii]|uniref:Small ribosomal subunit protein uS15c n=2 Tax=Gossypium stocksii TaxID=47602 RepID=A0A9D4A8Y7_9ROSI|nr:hypothetical protein J1N35_014080 [Gossypium stocksii]